MNTIVLLFLIGLIFLAFEVVVPGAVMGIIGGIAMLGGCVVAYSRFGATGGMVSMGAALALVGFTLYLEFVILPRTRMGRKMFLDAAVSGSSQGNRADELALIGKTAEALTVLSPSGYVSVDGKRFEAFCRDGHVEKGSLLRVSALDQFTLQVTKLTSSS